MALGSDAAASRADADTGPAGGSAPPSAAQAPEELIEIQLRGILETTQTSAGAVCLFDQHQELLRLAVEIGLSDEGCRRLRAAIPTPQPPGLWAHLPRLLSGGCT
jgi:hypothetical protein